MTTDFDVRVKLAVYRHFAETGRRPTPEVVAERVGADPVSVVEAYGRLRALRVMLLEPDGVSIRMAPPFSGVPTQHAVTSGGVDYFANCAWDALGIPAALRRRGTVHSRCEQTLEPLEMEVGVNGPGPSDWMFHCLVPAAQWWNDLVFT
jgi:Alkylmercury lyase